MITIHCSRACAHLASPPELLTAGMSKAVTVEFVFSPEWDGLTKTAVFSNGKTTVDVLAASWDGDTVPVPHEVLAVPGRHARVGVYGANESGVILPTVWVSLGKARTRLATYPPTRPCLSGRSSRSRSATWTTSRPTTRATSSPPSTRPAAPAAAPAAATTSATA